MAWHATEQSRGICDLDDPDVAERWVDGIMADFCDRSMLVEAIQSA